MYVYGARFYASSKWNVAVQFVLVFFLAEGCSSFCPSPPISFSGSSKRELDSCRRARLHESVSLRLAPPRRSPRVEVSCCSLQASSDAPAGSESAPLPEKRRDDFPYVLRRGRPHELDLLAILSTEAFTPRGKWYNVLQRLKHTLTVWDLQAQFYQRYYQWPQIIKEFQPPIEEARYALLVATSETGVAVGMTELCVCPSPVPNHVKAALDIPDASLYISNLAVSAEHRRRGVGEALVGWCEELGGRWGHGHVLLHVERDNAPAIAFYKTLGFTKVTRDIDWYTRIRRSDLAAQNTIVLFKELQPDGIAPDQARAGPHQGEPLDQELL